MEWFFVALLIAAPIIGLLGWLFWIFIAVLFVKGAAGAAAQQQKELEALFRQIEQLANTAGAGQGGTGFQNLSPQQRLQLQTMLMQAQNQMGQLDHLARQRYDLKVSELQGMAASAGIDWRPGG